jgi:hypothetical protein
VVRSETLYGGVSGNYIFQVKSKYSYGGPFMELSRSNVSWLIGTLGIQQLVRFVSEMQKIFGTFSFLVLRHKNYGKS